MRMGMIGMEVDGTTKMVLVGVIKDIGVTTVGRGVPVGMYLAMEAALTTAWTLDKRGLFVFHAPNALGSGVGLYYKVFVTVRYIYYYHFIRHHIFGFILL
jgi:hypothetical protein